MFNKQKLTYSFFLERGKGYYQQWTGPPLWQESAFGKVMEFSAGSGWPRWETFPATSKAFDHEFAVATPVILHSSRKIVIHSQKKL